MWCSTDQYADEEDVLELSDPSSEHKSVLAKPYKGYENDLYAPEESDDEYLPGLEEIEEPGEEDFDLYGDSPYEPYEEYENDLYAPEESDDEYLPGLEEIEEPSEEDFDLYGDSPYEPYEEYENDLYAPEESDDEYLTGQEEIEEPGEEVYGDSPYEPYEEYENDLYAPEESDEDYLSDDATEGISLLTINDFPIRFMSREQSSYWGDANYMINKTDFTWKK
jgi:hypothetical protein